jgi:hypothetical protein
VQGHDRAGANVRELHAAAKVAGAQAHESHAIAVLRVHVGLHLEDEGRHLRLGRQDGALTGLLHPRRGRQVGYAA